MKTTDEDWKTLNAVGSTTTPVIDGVFKPRTAVSNRAHHHVSVFPSTCWQRYKELEISDVC